MKYFFPLIIALVLFVGCSNTNNISGNYEGSLVPSEEHDLEMEKLGFKKLNTTNKKGTTLKLSLTQKDQNLSGILIITEKGREMVADVSGTFLDNRATIIGNFKHIQLSIILSGSYGNSSIKGKATHATATNREELAIPKDGREVPMPQPDFDFVLNKQ